MGHVSFFVNKSHLKISDGTYYGSFGSMSSPV